MKTPLLGNRRFYENVIIIGLPVALQNLLTTSASMVDTIMVGTVGETAVAAVGICALFSMLLFAGYFGFCNGGTIFFAQYWGAKDEKGICKAYGITLITMMTVGFVFGFFAVFFPELIMGMYTDKEGIREAGIPYLRIVGWSYPLQTLAMAMGSLLRSIEKVKIPLFASIASLITNTILNWLLIFGMFGFPKMGIRGAAVGTVIANVVHILVLYIYCLNDKYSFITRVREHYGWEKGFVKTFFSKIIFVVFNEVLYGVGQLLLNMIIGRQVESGIAAWAVFRVLEGFVFAFFGGLANASSVIVGKQIGAGEHLDGYRDAKRFVLLVPLVTLTIWSMVLLLRSPILHLFGLGEDAYFYAQGMLYIYMVTGTIRTCNYINNNIFRAAGESVFGTVIEICGLFIITIPAVALFGLKLNAPFLVVFGLIYLDEFLRIGILLWYMNSGKWVKPVTETGKAELPVFRKIVKGKL
ncbi:MATE family efflux transporter [Leadbettera azotonutricia]|uniref:MATE efflux family protein n=1 Tax=Leadbettera azotonutricia (strain ATCC BAA-888 / DSM 13862 / ZAS-9) TaxID=545695 RepID=F5Y9U3_LEAAZ|nr:MATE family efflux transporter [Leadbettera azotonutricia]AEF83442.1 MATE efflux family protein [Leadbettera azotonutricia ZAS-9]